MESKYLLPLTCLLDCVIIISMHSFKLLSPNNHTLQEVPSRIVTANAGKLMERALPQPRNPVQLETMAFPALRVRFLQEIDASGEFLVGPKLSIVIGNLFICVGVVSRTFMTFL